MHKTATVYSKPSCVQRTAKYRALDSKGIRYAVVDLTKDPAAIEQVKALGHLQTPVVVTTSDSSSGFWPDKIAHLRTHTDTVSRGNRQ